VLGNSAIMWLLLGFGVNTSYSDISGFDNDSVIQIATNYQTTSCGLGLFVLL
jgi:hypothetical protein